MNPKYHKVIGIDLGASYSKVAVYNNLHEQAGNLENTPSVISFDPLLHKAIVGNAAKRNHSSKPHDTIMEIKREMGATFDSSTLAKYNAQDSFEVMDPVQVCFGGQWMLPQEISALILMKMKEIAEDEIGEQIQYGRCV